METLKVWRTSPPVPQVSSNMPAVFAGNGDDFFAHDGGGADEFLDGGALGGQTDEQAADLGVVGLAAHDVGEGIAGFVAREVLAAGKF